VPFVRARICGIPRRINSFEPNAAYLSSRHARLCRNRSVAVRPQIVSCHFCAMFPVSCGIFMRRPAHLTGLGAGEKSEVVAEFTHVSLPWEGKKPMDHEGH
jgi:hypothetical protein